MQPLAYLAVRCCVSWLQFLERGDRAFASSVPIALTIGPVHCWSVVYALFIAVHLRTFRHIGHYEYEEKLPLWMWGIETVTIICTAVWWIASCALAFARVVSDDLFGLPSNRYETHKYTPQMFRMVLSKGFREAVEAAHALSGAGLLVCVLFLCMAGPLMEGQMVASEFCLIAVAFAFALAHVVLATRSLAGLAHDREQGAALAVASEAVCLGPQLCVVLTLASVSGQAGFWQKLSCVAATLAFGGALAACALRPPKPVGAALPPSDFEMATCLALDLIAGAVLIFCFPTLSGWPLWLLLLALGLAGFGLSRDELRAPLVELLDPIMPICSNSSGMRPAPQRDALRGLARGLALLCALAVLRDVGLHAAATSAPAPAPPDLPEEAHAGGWDGDFPYDSDGPEYPDRWSADTRLLLRWLPGKEVLGHHTGLQYASEALGIEAGQLAAERDFQEHRLLYFKFLGPIDRSRPHHPLHERWQEIVSAPSGPLEGFVDSSFPGYLDASLCLELPRDMPKEGPEAEGVREAVHYVLRSVQDEHARLAYADACSAWRHQMFTEEEDASGYEGMPPDAWDEGEGHGHEQGSEGQGFGEEHLEDLERQPSEANAAGEPPAPDNPEHFADVQDGVPQG